MNIFIFVNITVSIHLLDDMNIVFPAISTFAVQICYTNKFLLYSY
jgi:hypothetical protein